MMDISIKVETLDDVTEVVMKGRLDGNTMKEVEDQLESLIFQTKKTKVFFELKELEYISSAGLRVMLLSLKRITANQGKLVLCELQQNVQEIFNLSGFSSIFKIVATREEALLQL